MKPYMSTLLHVLSKCHLCSTAETCFVTWIHCLPRSENYRKAVVTDVEAKLSAVTAARDQLRSKMDESKVWCFGAVAIAINFETVSMNIVCNV